MRLTDVDDPADAVVTRNQAAETLRDCDAIIALRPSHAETHCKKGHALKDLLRSEEALLSFNRAIELKPDYAEAYNGLASVLHGLGQSAKALQSYSRAIELRPDFAEAYLNLARLLRDRGRLDLAIEVYDRLIEVKPDFAEAHNSKGAVLQRLSRYEDALESHNRAVDLAQDFAMAHNDRGVALHQLKRCEQAVESFDKAIALQPDSARAYHNKSLCVLLSGDWELGGELYEWRKKLAAPLGSWTSPEPEWTGRECLIGKTLFIHAEQGFGDTIQFCRYALLAAARGAKVILAAHDRLMRLLKGLGPSIEIVSQSAAPSAFDFHGALMSMPLAFNTTTGTCPANVPYLRAEPDRVEMWKERLGSYGFKIGICWQGGRHNEIDIGRSFPVRHFEGLAKIPNVRLISLQMNDGVEQLLDLPADMRVETLGDDFDAGPDAFVDTAAVMECLDLVITSDTAVAHLAGALARPTWVALKYVPDWRWLLDRSDCPWYPTMRLFRQSAPGDWASVFAAITAEFAQFIERAGGCNDTCSSGADGLLHEAVACHRHGRLPEAIDIYQTFLRHNPDVALAHFNLAVALQSLKRFDEALQSYESAIMIQPDYAEAHLNKGFTLLCLDRNEEALRSYDKVIALKPRYADGHYSRGNALRRLNRFEEALCSFDRAIQIRPDHVEAHNNRGNTLKDLNRLQEALRDFDRAIALKPDFAGAHSNKGYALRLQKRLDEAIQCYDRAVALRPDFAEAYWDKAICLLSMGDLEAGWPLFEWRKKRAKQSGFRSDARPEWTGRESLEGRTLLIHAEQGLGDSIQFCRYAMLARERGAKVVMAVDDALMRLLKSLGPEIEIVSRASVVDAFDYHVALMSLPLAFATTLGTCPAKVPYLHAEPERVAMWKGRIGSEGFRIGICWQGNKKAEIDVGRSFPVRHIEALAKLPKVRLISLQKNDGLEQLADLSPDINVETLGAEFDAGPHAFVDTAAVMECLDLVVSSDTAIAHLAGALARPTWIALKYVPDWRWLLDRSDSPWYPTVKLFRQPAPGDWASLFEAMKAQLAAEIRPNICKSSGSGKDPSSDDTNDALVLV